jgi:hypothetical protein
MQLWEDQIPRAFWQPRYHDFNVFSEKKYVEKLRYIHRNPVKRGPGGISGLVAVEQLSRLPVRGGWEGEDRNLGDTPHETHPLLRAQRARSPQRMGHPHLS